MSGPLTGITVIDVTTNISGPSLTMILADLGAKVIKIERPDIGDDSRGMGPHWEGEGVYFLHINRNKESIVVNLKNESGRQIVYDLVNEADVFVENFRYSKVEELGLGYEKLKEINPSLIYCSLSAYGEEGPRRNKPGYDAITQADSGIIGINGVEGSDLSRVPISVLDQGSAMWGAMGVISALYHREKTGEGQKVSTSLYETGVFWVGYHMLAWKATGAEPNKLGTNHAAFAPYGAFEAQDVPLMIGISNNSLFARLCKVLRKEEWIKDQRFAENHNRVRNRIELNNEIEKILKTKTADEWIILLEVAGVPSSKVKNISEVVNDEQTEALGIWEDVPHTSITDLSLPRLPFQLTVSPTAIKEPPPKLGQDTTEILRSLGYDEETINKYILDGIVQSAKIETN